MGGEHAHEDNYKEPESRAKTKFIRTVDVHHYDAHGGEKETGDEEGHTEKEYKDDDDHGKDYRGDDDDHGKDYRGDDDEGWTEKEDDHTPKSRAGRIVTKFIRTVDVHHYDPYGGEKDTGEDGRTEKEYKDDDDAHGKGYQDDEGWTEKEDDDEAASTTTKYILTLHVHHYPPQNTIIEEVYDETNFKRH